MTSSWMHYGLAWLVRISTFFKGHWQSPCTVLTGGKCLPFELCMDTMKQPTFLPLWHIVWRIWWKYRDFTEHKFWYILTIMSTNCFECNFEKHVMDTVAYFVHILTYNMSAFKGVQVLKNHWLICVDSLKRQCYLMKFASVDVPEVP